GGQRTAAEKGRQLPGQAAQRETLAGLPLGKGRQSRTLLRRQRRAALADPYGPLAFIFLQMRKKIENANAGRIVGTGFEYAQAAIGAGDYDARVVGFARQSEIVRDPPEAGRIGG